MGHLIVIGSRISPAVTIDPGDGWHLRDTEIETVFGLDEAAFFEGFCPNCRVPLGGNPRNWCPQCRTHWNVIRPLSDADAETLGDLIADLPLG